MGREGEAPTEPVVNMRLGRSLALPVWRSRNDEGRKRLSSAEVPTPSASAPIPRSTAPRPRRVRQRVLHLGRWGLFVLIVVLIRQQHLRCRAQTLREGQTAISWDRARCFFPEGVRFADGGPDQGGRTVVDAQGKPLGFVVQTAPASDQVIGYSGPTNTLIAFDQESRILGLEVLDCGDTPEHARAVRNHPQFLKSFNGLTWEEARQQRDLDGVSGATLTSLAIAEGVVRRLGGAPHSYRFPEPLHLADAQRFFPQAARLIARSDLTAVWEVQDAAGHRLGSLAHTSPASDNLIGFQGPTDTLLALDPQDRVLGIAVRKSYETEMYVGWVTDEPHFMQSFNGQRLDELAALDLREAGVEGVSGATMTSLAMARGLVAAAGQLRSVAPLAPRPPLLVAARDVGTALLIAGGLLLAFTKLRGRRPVRIGFQLLTLGYLGLLHGDMVSQALLVGWAQSGSAWQFAPGLCLLVAVAFLVPLLTRKQVYCHQLCPHGAAQQLLHSLALRRSRAGRLHPPRWLVRILQTLPAWLLLGVLLVALLHWPFNLAALEPFDAYLFRIAGWATLTVAALGLLAACFVPLAYCRYGCPTGALLNYLRFHGHSDRLSRQDLAAAALLLLALALRLGFP